MQTLFRRAIRDLDVGWVAELADGATALTALASASLTIPSLFQNSNMGSNQLINGVAWRLGAASVADYERPLGSLTNSTGLVAQVGANYSDTTVGSEIPYILKHNVRVADWVAALNRAMEKVFFTTTIALSHLSDLDGDMVATTDTNWTDIGSLSTSAKATTARRTPFGVRSYNTVNNASANAGTRSATLDITAGHRAKAFTIASTNVGTSSLQLYSITGTAVADTAAVTSSEEAPQLLHQDWQVISSSAKEWALNLTNTAATGDTFWNMAWAYKEDELVVPLPSYVSEHYQVPMIWQLRPDTIQTGANVYPARGLMPIPLEEGRDYFPVINQEDANPSAVRFADTRFFDWPLVVQARIPEGYVTQFTSDESLSTKAAINEILPLFERELLDTVYANKLPADQWARLSAQVGQVGPKLPAEQQKRPIKPIARPVRYFSGIGHGI